VYAQTHGHTHWRACEREVQEKVWERGEGPGSYGERRERQRKGSFLRCMFRRMCIHRHTDTHTGECVRERCRRRCGREGKDLEVMEREEKDREKEVF